MRRTRATNKDFRKTAKRVHPKNHQLGSRGGIRL